MSLYGALFGGVSGLRAQSSKIGAISDNIANSNTIGYKKSTAVFQTLVINSGNAGSYQTGGVRAGTQMNISQQGLLSSTNSSTDIAISGGGFFVVRNAAVAVVGESSSTPYYTRAGSFTQDARGNFVNAQGFFLQGWPLDRKGQLPGEGDNPNNVSSTNFDSIETVNVESASGIAQATSEISLGANLKATETVFPGSAGVLVPDINDSNNRNLKADQIIVGAEFDLADQNSLNRGDAFSVSINGGAQTFTYEYGGFTVGRSASSAGSFGDNRLDNKANILLDGATNISYDGTNSFIFNIPNHGLIDGEEVTLASLTGDTGTPGFYGTTPISELNTALTVDRIDADHFRVTVATAHGVNTSGGPVAATATDDFTADVRTAVFNNTGNIFNADSVSANFLTGVTNYTDAAKTFTISAATAGTRTFTYTSGSPNANNGEFNSLNTLATAINAVNGLTARIVDGRLVVGAEDAQESVTFVNGDAGGSSTARGLDWIGELGLSNITQTNNRFSSLASLAKLVNNSEGLSATLTNPLSTASLSIQVDSPLQTIQFSDLAAPIAIPGAPATGIDIPAGTYHPTDASGPAVPISVTVTVPNSFTVGDTITLAGMDLPAGTGVPYGDLLNGTFLVTAATGSTVTFDVVPPQAITIVANGVPAPGQNQYSANADSRLSVTRVSNQGSVLGALGLDDSLAGADYLAEVTANGVPTTGVINPKYDATGVSGSNMASGTIPAQFSRNVRIYDAQGSGHDVRFSFIKTATNSWAFEAHVIPETDITTGLGFVDGQIATGSLNFNGDGTLQSIDLLPNNGIINIAWTNGASDSSLSFDLGTAGALGTGLADGMSQFSSGYNVNFANQDGAPVGQLVSVSINETGQVIASYSNGQIQALYQLPLADFSNPDGLVARSGNIFEQSSDSGEVNLREANSNGTGTIVAGALEQSNVDLAEELTDMIVAQRAYQANTKVIRTADELLESLNQI